MKEEVRTIENVVGTMATTTTETIVEPQMLPQEWIVGFVLLRRRVNLI